MKNGRLSIVARLSEKMGEIILDEGQSWNNANEDQQRAREIVEGYLSWAIDIGLLTSSDQVSNVINRTIQQGWVY